MSTPMEDFSIGSSLDNDTRGWIMSCVSGIACVLGAAIICVDVLANKLFKNKSFRIAESQAFLSSSLSLSAGVLIFTSLYSMLPNANSYLVKSGYSATASAYMMIGLFVLGVIVIRIVSALIHSHLPSSIVECDPPHKNDHKDIERGEAEPRSLHTTPDSTLDPSTLQEQNERSPLLQHNAHQDDPRNAQSRPTRGIKGSMFARSTGDVPQTRTRPSLGSRLSQQVFAVVLQTKPPSCNKIGRCFGFSHPCPDDCIGCGKRPITETCPPNEQGTNSEPNLPSANGALGDPQHGMPDAVNRPSSCSHSPQSRDLESGENHGSKTPSSASTTLTASPGSGPDAQHHHHVPQDEFLSLGLQTSLAIALHKLPEGFITYATNHASPTLGWSVFLALFIHNITEGFAMCLPLYLALDSRFKAMLWSSLLGGISQPAGAGLAALWVWGTQNEGHGGGDHSSDDISWAVYGGMFAATAGVMTNVALQLFSESFRRSHNHSMCIGFAIAGMGILGLSFALTAE